MSFDAEMDYDDGSSSEYQEEIEDKILDLPGIQSLMKSSISEVQPALEVSEGVGRILLQKFKWNKDPLMDRFYETSDIQEFLKTLSVDSWKVETPSDSPEAPESKKLKTAEEDSQECDICCDVGDLSGPSCSHLSCPSCWHSYISERINEGQSEIECMASKCKLIMPDELVLTYIKDDLKTLASFNRLIINNFVQSNTHLKWCPGVDCGRVVYSSSTDPHVVLCDCGERFCFSCGNDGHEPVNCKHLKLWIKKSLDDSETSNWLNANTKDCPRCSVPIEKNGGCNYIRCTNKTCLYQFCWICMNAWTVHAQAWYNCNAFVPTEATASAELARDQAKAILERYLFYFHRYRGHQQSLEMEKKLIAKIEEKMEELQQDATMFWNDVLFLRQAVDVLSQCRRTMMYTYVFAFYLKKSNQSTIFENNQKDLEMATEQLSGFLERDLEDEENRDLKTLKLKVQDKCRYIQHRRKVLLDHCAEGVEQETWEYIE